MSVAKSLPPVAPFFMQECPMCGTSHRMMIRGLYVENGKSQLYPDMGYSFCNCQDIFFTKWENITSEDGGFNSCRYPSSKLNEVYLDCEHGQQVTITMRDPYFVIWTRPHEFTGFNPRVNYTLWDMGSFVSMCKSIGFEVLKAERDMDVNSETPECYHITLRKP